jgi:putative ABC transport system ATP-binding protein
MLDVRNISKTYAGPDGKVQALTNISVQVAAGEFVAVRGPSGSGKTTLLLAAGGMLRPDAGQVLVGGQDIYHLTTEARARFRAASIGFVFQQFHLVPYLNVLENILAAALAYPGPNLREQTDQLIAELGLSHRTHHLPSELSSGERQRTALARAMLHRPPVLLADEPTGNLDDHNGRIVLDHLSDYVARGGALLLVTHDRRAADRAQRVLQLGSGPRRPQ